ncbi:MAG: efflux RND transporter periplasmic adaptor subunit [Eubacteriales bacterium]|nr:efflux RND transporter periplasmic adaptor subunit [Eubacteriales bacterium]
MKKKKRKKRRIIPTVLVIGVLAVGGARAYQLSRPQEIALPLVETAPVQKGTVALEVDASGTIVSNRVEKIFSPVTGKIAQADFSQGDLVEKGSLMVSFDVSELEKNLKKAELSGQSGEADYEQTVKQAQEAVEKQENAKAKKAELEQQVEAKQAYIAQLKKQLSSVNLQTQIDARNQANAVAAQAAQAASEAAQASQQAYEEALSVYQRTTLPEYEAELGIREYDLQQAQLAYQQAVNAYDMAFTRWQADASAENEAALHLALEQRSQMEIQKNTAQNAYEELKNSPPQMPVVDMTATSSADLSSSSAAPIVDTSEVDAALEKASSELAELQAELSAQKTLAEADSPALTEEEQEKLQISRELNGMDIENAREMLEKGKKGVSAGFTGVISETAAVQGAAVTEGMELFTLQSTEDVSVDVNISKYDFDKIKEGQKADITMGDYTYSGTVSKVSKIAAVNEKGVSVIQASVKIDNPDENIFIGVDAKVKIHARKAEDVLTIPAEAVNVGKDGSFCYVLENNMVVRKDIVTGISSAEMTEVEEGLLEGDEVIIEIGELQEGQTAQSAQTLEDEEDE